MSPRWGSKIFPGRTAINMSSLTGLRLVLEATLEKKKGSAMMRFPNCALPHRLTPAEMLGRGTPEVGLLTLFLQRCRARNDFNDLAGDCRLPDAIHVKSQRRNQLAGIL
jgi:hypothetical protein